MSFADIVKQMTDHYQPRPSTIVQRFKIHSRSRKPGESVATYIAELKQLSENCALGDFLQEMLRDRIVCGINDPRIQRRLLAESELNYKSAFVLAQSMETADQNTNDLQLQLVMSHEPDKMNFTTHHEQLSHVHHTTVLPAIVVEEAIKLWIANIKTLSVILVGRKAT